MFLQLVLTKVIIEQEKKEWIRNAFAGVLYNTGLERGESAFVVVDFIGGIKNSFVLPIIGSGRRIAELTLNLKTCDYQIKWVDAKVGNRRAGWAW